MGSLPSRWRMTAWGSISTAEWPTGWACWESRSGRGSYAVTFGFTPSLEKGPGWKCCFPGRKRRRAPRRLALLDDALAHRVQHDVGRAVEIQLLHQPAPM